MCGICLACLFVSTSVSYQLRNKTQVLVFRILSGWKKNGEAGTEPPPPQPLGAPAAESRRRGLELLAGPPWTRKTHTLSGFPYYFPKVLVPRRTTHRAPLRMLVWRWLILCVRLSGMSARHPRESAARGSQAALPVKLGLSTPPRT